jgi:hypothetical protein
MSAASLRDAVISMLVCIVKVPPARMLEGMDLRPYRLRRAEIRELPRPVSDVLLAWGYAELCADRRRPGNPRIAPNRPTTGKNKK